MKTRIWLWSLRDPSTIECESMRLNREVFSILCLAAWLVSTVAIAQPPTQPNLILIVTDDQGWGDLGCHGNPVIDTPHLDAMASRGAMLDRIEPQSYPALENDNAVRFSFPGQTHFAPPWPACYNWCYVSALPQHNQFLL